MTNIHRSSGPNALHFSGVYRDVPGRAKKPSTTGIDTFEHQGKCYYTTEEDTDVLCEAYLLDLYELDLIWGEPLWRRSVHEPTPDIITIKETMQYLAAKEPNNQFQKALSEKNISQVLVLLQNPDVQLSDADDPEERILAERLLGIQDNFTALAKQLGGASPAKAFVEKLLAAEVEPDLKEGLGSQQWAEHPKANYKKMALQIAQDTMKVYEVPNFIFAPQRLLNFFWKLLGYD